MSVLVASVLEMEAPAVGAGTRAKRPRFDLGGLLLLALVAVLVLSVTSCAGNPFPVAKPGSGPSVAPPRISTVTVGRHALHVFAVFSDPKSRADGLQHKLLPPASAAVFTWGGQTSTEAFWMINTPEPLSVGWIAAGRLIGHAEMARCAMSCPTYKAPGPYDTAVEAPAGTFAHTRRGQLVSFA